MPMRARWVLSLLLLVAVALTAEFGFFFFRDNVTTHYPLKVISARAFRAAEIPWWNFHDFGGQPLAGNPNALTFYPDNVFYLFVPAHVAFNLHFLIHLAAGFLAMRALCLARGVSSPGARFGAVVWTLSGVVVSATAFYNLITAVALIPLALYAVERSSPRLLGIAFGLLLLAGEPVTLVGAFIAVSLAGIGRMPFRGLATAALIAAAIGTPQIVAFSEIAGEVERVVPIQANLVLVTSLTWKRVAEIFLWPLLGFLNDPGGERQRLFSTIFIGIIAVPALWRRSRYTAVAVVLLVLSLGRNVPFVTTLVAAFPSIRIMRFPEKLVLPMTAALVVLIAEFFDRSGRKREWALITIAPLLWVTMRALPMDWFAPYRVTPRPPVRIHSATTVRAGSMPARLEFRTRAHHLDWLFGATANLRYAIGRSPDRMHSLLSRSVVERFEKTTPALRERYLRINACNVPGALPQAMIVPMAIGAPTILHAIRVVEDPAFDEHRIAVAPMSLHRFTSAPGRVTGYRVDGQTVRVAVSAKGPVLLMVNETFFDSWVARGETGALTTVPLDVDRLGIVVPAGVTNIVLTFGRYRAAVVGTWVASTLLMILLLGVEYLDRRSRQIEGARHENVPVV